MEILINIKKVFLILVFYHFTISDKIFNNLVKSEIINI